MRRVTAVAACLILAGASAWAGGPLLVTGPVATQQGRPFTWDAAAMPIRYTVDGGPLSSARDNAAGRALVASAASVWQSLPTAAITFLDASIAGDADVESLSDFAEATQACDNASRSPIIFDANGSLLRDLGSDPFVIGFAGPCALDSVTGHIRSALMLLNGQFLDGVTTSVTQLNPEITVEQFEEATAHEFGHFLGLDHSQINADVLGQTPDNCSADLLAGLPLMFPIAQCQARKSAGLPVLAPDDMAWISRLYPGSSFTSSYGTVRGLVYFPDGISQFQGANIIAQRVDDPGTPGNESLRIAVSAVSGLYFTANPGQSVTGDNTGGSPFGSRDPAVIGYYEIPVLPGSYALRLEGIRTTFTGGSSVGPLDPPASVFGVQGPSNPIDVSAGQTVSGADFHFIGDMPRFDRFEDGIVRNGFGHAESLLSRFFSWLERWRVA